MGFADLAAIDRFIGTSDHRARSFVPLVLRLAGSATLTAQEQDELFAFLPPVVVAYDDEPSLHLFDVKPVDNLVLRILEPASSALRPSYDYLTGRTPAEVVQSALDAALTALRGRYGTSDISKWRRPHPTSSVCSLTGGVIGPCLTMPFEDRGTYIHLVAFT